MPSRSRKHRIKAGQIWSRYSLDGNKRLTGYLVRKVAGDLITAEPVNARGKVIGPRMLFDAEFLTRYYLEPTSDRTGKTHPVWDTEANNA